MSGQKSTTPVTRDCSEPAERIDHYFSRITRASENIDAMAVGGVLFRTAIASRNQRSGNGRQSTAAGKESLQKCRADAEPSGQNLRLRHMAEILVSELVGEHPAQLVIVCPL